MTRSGGHAWATRSDEASGAPDGTWDRFWSDRRDLERVYPSSPKVREAIVRHAGPLDGARVLEIGSGTGRDTAALAGLGARAVALDTSASALELVRLAAPDRIGRGIVQGDAFHLPFPDGTFDVVFHQGVLEHFGNPWPFLAENHRVTRPDGLLVVDVPQTWHPWTALKRVAIRLDAWFAGWERDYTIDQLERVVTEAGWRVVETYADWMVPGLGYRLTREALRRAGLAELPLRAPAPEGVRRARAAVRERLLETGLGRRTAHTIGVVARKPAG